MGTLTDQVAIVTGASSGIGKAVALSLASAGAQLHLLGRRPDALEAVSQLCAGRVPVRCHKVDLGDDDSMRSFLEIARAEIPRLDILVHSAGAIQLNALEIAPLKDLDIQYRVNLRAPFALTQAFLPLLRATKGQIVFVNSTAGLMAMPNVSQYAATKFALRGLADSLRQEVQPDQVRVLSVYPGRTASPMQQSVRRSEGKEYHPEQLIQPQDVATAIVHALEAPRSVQVTDIQLRAMLLLN